MSEVDYQAAVKRARELTARFDPPFDQLAFAPILADLLRDQREGEKGLSVKEPVQTTIPTPQRRDVLDAFMSRGLDAEPYSDLFSSSGHLLEKCLAVLKLARDEFGIDGLTPGEIVNVLVKKFRVGRVHGTNVSRDIGHARKYVSKIHRGKHPTYLITVAGENHLNEVIQSQG
jgi:hypothetical protein